MTEASVRPRIVIIGGGFAGLSAARALEGAPADLLLIDRRNHHLFQPLLYQVATAALSPADIAAPIRRVLRSQSNARVVLGQVDRIDLDTRALFVRDRRVDYDYLVLAAGVHHAYFGHPEWEPLAPGLKSVEDALEIRRRILLAFEAAEIEPDPAARERALTFVVVGGGPTGVELAGAIREIAANSIPADFRRVDTTTARIILIEGEDRLLPSMSEEASHDAKAQLEQMGVEVRVGTRVTEVDRIGVMLGDERVPASNVIWAAGVEGEAVGRSMGVELDDSGRVRVEADCSIPGYPTSFVVGDLASLHDKAFGDLVPGVAPAAIQMGRFVANLIRDELGGRGEPGARPVFRYKDKGTLATIGKARAVADVGGRTFGGLFAWLLWSLVHIAYLIGFRNRAVVMLSWAWNYVVHLRGARLITGDAPRSDQLSDGED